MGIGVGGDIQKLLRNVGAAVVHHVLPETQGGQDHVALRSRECDDGVFLELLAVFQEARLAFHDFGVVIGAVFAGSDPIELAGFGLPGDTLLGFLGGFGLDDRFLDDPGVTAATNNKLRHRRSPCLRGA